MCAWDVRETTYLPCKDSNYHIIVRPAASTPQETELRSREDRASRRGLVGELSLFRC